MMDPHLKNMILMLADNSMILGQRLGEWCGHGPVLEQDIALTNISLDLIGEARNYYHYLAETEGKQEDDYPMQRDVRSFKNVLLTEQPNGNWGNTIMRQLMFDCYHYYMLEGMTISKDLRLASIAKKSIKESAYHLSFSGEWVIRLGDGTTESHDKMQHALDNLMPFFDEMFLPSDYELYCSQHGYAPDPGTVYAPALAKLKHTLTNATLLMPEKYFIRKGGKTGFHSEHLGYILAELQYMQRVYPGVEW